MTIWLLLYILCKTRSNKLAEGHEKQKEPCKCNVMMEGKKYTRLKV